MVGSWRSVIPWSRPGRILSHVYAAILGERPRARIGPTRGRGSDRKRGWIGGVNLSREIDGSRSAPSIVGTPRTVISRRRSPCERLRESASPRLPHKRCPGGLGYGDRPIVPPKLTIVPDDGAPASDVFPPHHGGNDGDTRRSRHRTGNGDRAPLLLGPIERTWTRQQGRSTAWSPRLGTPPRWASAGWERGERGEGSV